MSFEPFKRRPCKNAFSLTILSDGTVTGCPYDAEGSLCNLGNLKEKSLMEIWNSSSAKAWRESHLLIKLNKDCYCKNCQDWYKMT